MAVRDIVLMGNPILLRTADLIRPEEFGTPALAALIKDLQDTMVAMSGAGIAAPQIGVSKQITIFGGFKSPRYPDAEAVPYTILCNPVLTPLSDEMADDWEGCLSVPGLRGVVPRYEHLRYQGMDENGQPIDRQASGFHARVAQHECDHLFGKLYPMRITDMSKFGFTEVLFPNQLPPED
ncbi:peptide deformylase [Chitinimonas sp. BJB300]|uniref:peptide deformylase n=1 Tax=Chitinimonas sp. BJB300 TaxID=1559339 RepID=UPI000C1188EC|nr:peptide deformylase [Chitinimonas sp. BJB300]PHV12489.1 peptide deformylase [Chitinimonas sp. BJB300]TSJ89122.1 peptide deformylase [Chitinimonas sp. BJB300]